MKKQRQDNAQQEEALALVAKLELQGRAKVLYRGSSCAYKVHPEETPTRIYLQGRLPPSVARIMGA